MYDIPDSQRTRHPRMSSATTPGYGVTIAQNVDKGVKTGFDWLDSLVNKSSNFLDGFFDQTDQVIDLARKLNRVTEITGNDPILDPDDIKKYDEATANQLRKAEDIENRMRDVQRTMSGDPVIMPIPEPTAEEIERIKRNLQPTKKKKIKPGQRRLD